MSERKMVDEYCPRHGHGQFYETEYGVACPVCLPPTCYECGGACSARSFMCTACEDEQAKTSACRSDRLALALTRIRAMVSDALAELPTEPAYSITTPRSHDELRQDLQDILSEIRKAGV